MHHRSRLARSTQFDVQWDVFAVTSQAIDEMEATGRPKARAESFLRSSSLDGLIGSWSASCRFDNDFPWGKIVLQLLILLLLPIMRRREHYLSIKAAVETCFRTMLQVCSSACSPSRCKTSEDRARCLQRVEETGRKARRGANCEAAALAYRI